MWGIRFNNNREWFLPRKEIYQEHLLRPTRELAEQVYEALHAELPDEPLLVKVSRIYRDARRLHGQGPYKDHLWFCIRTGDRDWTGRPTFYFEISPEYYSYGMGFWQARPELMTLYRRQIETDPEPLAHLVRRFNRQTIFSLSGSDYARPKGNVGALLQPWYQKKSINLEHTVALDERIFSPALADEVAAGMKELSPFYRYFSDLCARIYHEA